MNLLPFMTILLVILAIFSQSFFKNYRQLMIESRMYRGHYIADRKARNAVEDLYYKRAVEVTKGSTQTKTAKTFPYIREGAFFHEKGRLNLYTLLKKGKDQQKELYRLSAELLKHFYGQSAFWSDGLEKQILKEWMRAGKEKKGEITFAEMMEVSQALQGPLYKMIRGSGIYDLIENEGYPPLNEIFRIEKEERSPLAFKVAHREILIVALGEKLYEEVRKAEMLKRAEHPEKRDISLEKSEFKALLGKNFQKDPSALELFSFEGVSNKKEVVMERDTTTKQTCKRSVK